MTPPPTHPTDQLDTQNRDHDGAPTAVPAAGTYRLDPSTSRITFTTRHLFGLGAVRGRFDVDHGTLTVPELAAGPATEQGLMLVVAVPSASVDTGSAGRDRAVRSARLLDSATHQDLSFTADHAVRDGATWRVPGRLVAHGTAAPVELTVHELTVDDRS